MLNDLNSFMDSFCKAGADAVRQYVTISGEPPGAMPEYFLGSSLFIALGGSRAITLETSLRQLHRWASEAGPTPDLSQGIGGWKYDMTIYDGVGLPDQQKAWALVELKRGSIDADLFPYRRTDRAKLLSTVEMFAGARPHLICAGSLHEEGREYHDRKARKLGDQWFEAATEELPFQHGKMWFCARVLAA